MENGVFLYVEALLVWKVGLNGLKWVFKMRKKIKKF